MGVVPQFRDDCEGGVTLWVVLCGIWDEGVWVIDSGLILRDGKHGQVLWSCC